MEKDELLAMSYRMAQRLRDLSRCQAPVVERLEQRFMSDHAYMLAAKQIARV